MPSPFLYPYDPEGIAPSNFIPAEHVVVVAPTDPERANFIVPRAAPFFQIGLVVRTGPLITDPVLNEGTDYILMHPFIEATRSLSKAIYGSIMFVDRTRSGDIYLDYQTLGGPYTLADYSIVEELTRSLYNIRVVTWTQVTGLPIAFPALPHPTDAADLIGMTELLAAVEAITAAITTQGANVPSLAAAFLMHITALSGSHTKAQIGLPNVSDYPDATFADVDANANDRFMVPEKTNYAIAKAFITLWQRLTHAGIDASLALTNSLVGANLDGVIDPGEYYYTTTCINKPDGSNFGLMKVWRETSSIIYQLAQLAHNGGFAWRYREVGGAWSSWTFALYTMPWNEFVFLGNGPGGASVSGSLRLPAGCRQASIRVNAPGGAGGAGGQGVGGDGGGGGAGGFLHLIISGAIGGLVVSYDIPPAATPLTPDTSGYDDTHTVPVDNPPAYISVGDDSVNVIIISGNIYAGQTGGAGMSEFSGDKPSIGGVAGINGTYNIARNRAYGRRAIIHQLLDASYTAATDGSTNDLGSHGIGGTVSNDANYRWLEVNTAGRGNGGRGGDTNTTMPNRYGLAGGAGAVVIDIGDV